METTKSKIEAYFRGLTFEEMQHEYSIENVGLPSVSKLIKLFHKPFNAEVMSNYTAIKENTTQEQVLKNWDEIREEACNRGHRVHQFAEDFVYNNNIEPICGQEAAVVKFFAEIPEHIQIITVEPKMYHKTMMYAGTCDLLLYNRRTDKFIIVDYKTNKDIFKNYKGKTLSYPFDSLLDSPFNKYQIQLSLYQMLFEQTGFKVEERKLIWLLPDGEYKMYDTDDITKTLTAYLITRN
jgi:ATP-dependent exoDNAse (exonuclease V) beta subunit